jgi:two-component system, LytTR family, sensor histidine kinase AlgZ
LIPLRDELALLHAYLSVEQIRFSSRLKVEENTASGALDSLLPPLLLQPLVENAVRHGVAQLTEGGWIRIEIRQPEPENLAIAIENNFDPEAPRRKGAGIGLRNVRQRLDASYGNRAKLDVRANHDRFIVSLNLPAEKEP